jgi:hypothetical protein
MFDEGDKVEFVMARSLSLTSSFFSLEPLLFFAQALFLFLLLQKPIK